MERFLESLVETLGGGSSVLVALVALGLYLLVSAQPCTRKGGKAVNFSIVLKLLRALTALAGALGALVGLNKRRSGGGAPPSRKEGSQR